MSERVFGHIVGISEGTLFSDRTELSVVGVHRPRQAGISGGASEGADSIVLSGGYEDDIDDGDIIVYTGHGGRDPKTRQQIGDQLLTRGNMALATSCIQGLPVRVIRGVNHPSSYAPANGYRYDGLFRVEDFWRDRGKSGHIIWRFRLVKIIEEYTSARSIAKMIKEEQKLYVPVPRKATLVQRIVRDTAQARIIKELYDYQCQMCGIRLESAAGPYAEAAHIRPLGAPHHGPDTSDNIVCLCPNHHVLFDYGSIAIDDGFVLLGAPGMLNVVPGHIINIDYVRYHRDHYYKGF